jgi:hypothetical protein
MHKHILPVLLLSSVLSACGGCGGSTNASNGPTANDKALLDSALTNIVKTLPEPSKAFTGAMVTINGTGGYYFNGASEKEVAKAAGQYIVDNPVKYTDEYRLLLSADGLKVGVLGDASVSKLGNVVQPVSKFVVKLTSGGVVVSVI